MSRTAETTITTSPVKKFISFNGNLGKFGVMAEGEKEMTDLAFPFTFVVLDNDAFNVGGATSLAEGAPRFSSNMAHRGFSTDLTVSLAGNVLGSGTWGQLKIKPELSKARYQGLIFAIADLGQGKELVRISLHGKALYEWGVFAKEVNVTGDTAIQVKNSVSTKSESTGLESLVPVFGAVKVSQETLDLAAKMDSEVLQPWFREYFGADTTDAVTEPGVTAPAMNNAPTTAQTSVTTNPTNVSAQNISLEAPPSTEDNLDLPF